ALSQENPDTLRIAADHPVTPVRFVQMQKAAAEIADKQRRGLPLNPELKSMESDAISGSTAGGRGPLREVASCQLHFLKCTCAPGKASPIPETAYRPRCRIAP